MRHILAIMCLLASLMLNAAQFTILRLNTPTITINDKELKVGDRFADTDTIKWKPSQVMKVESSTGHQRVLLAKEFIKKKSRSIREYISSARGLSVESTGIQLTHNNHLSTRDMSLSTTNDHRKFLSDEFILWDTITINTSWTTNERSYFTLTYSLGGENMTHKLPATDKGVTINREMFPPTAEETPVKCTVNYVEEEYGDTTAITSSMEIILIDTAK